MTIRISVADCIAIFEAEIDAGVLVSPEKLAAAVAAPFSGSAEMEFFPTVIEKAARLAFGISEAQAFLDGNKRLAWMATVVFLSMNGVELDVDQDEAAHVIRMVGAGRANLAQLTEWFTCCALPGLHRDDFSF